MARPQSHRSESHSGLRSNAVHILCVVCTFTLLPQVGVFTGYSSLAVALALPPDGRLVAFDRDAKTMAVAQKYWQLAGVSDKVRTRPGLYGIKPWQLQTLFKLSLGLQAVACAQTKPGCRLGP